MLLTVEETSAIVVISLHEGDAMRMGLREANQRFSKAINAVREGEEVILTDRGKAIAVIKPLKGGGNNATRIRKLEQAGLLRAAVKSRPLPPFRARPIAGKPLSKTVSEERDRAL